MRATPVFGERALLAETAGPRTLVVGDLHVGLEGDLHRAGVHLPSQTERMRERLRELVASQEADRLVVLGDLKDTIAGTSRQEREELPVFFAGLGVEEVHLLPGNHDAEVESLVEGVEVHDPTGWTLEGEVGLCHGHSWPAEEVMSCPVVVVCHNHPMVLLVDELGHRHKEPCWMRASFREAARERYPSLPEDGELVMMPAFNDLLGGQAINGGDGSLLGPLLGNDLVDVPGARLFTLDGLELGTVAALRRFGDAVAEEEPAATEGMVDGGS